MAAPDMSYPTDIKMWNKGRVNAWNTARDPGFGMSYFNRTDLPFYYALADAFTIGD
jgi:phospholipase C